MFLQGEFDLRLYEHGSAGGWAGKWSSFWRPCSYSFSPQFRADLRRELDRGFDLLHLETLWTGWVGLEHRQRAILNLHSLYRIDQSLDRPCRWSDRLRRWCVWRGERWLIRQYPVHIALSSRLADSIKAIHPKAAVHTIPLGLDLTGYAFQPKAANGGAPALGLIGSFGWGPTDLAGHRLLARLWPAIHRRVPQARLRIVGRDAKRFMAPYGSPANVEVLENVPAIEPHFRDLDVMLYAPAVGSGMKVKVLEAIAFGVPVVTNAEGAEGLPVVDGVHAGVAEDDEGLVERTVALLQDETQRRRQAEAARRMFEEICNPRRLLGLVERAHASLPAR